VNRGGLRAVAQREFETVVRTRFLVAFAAGYVGLTVGLAALVAEGSYAGLVLDVLGPTEALVSLFAFVLGYRSIVADREREELETLRTYPLTRLEYVLGVYVGRAVPVVALVALATAGSGLMVAFSGGDGQSVIATHATADSPVLFLRFAVLTVLFALVVLAVAVLVSAAARASRAAIGLAGIALLALVVGLDTGLIAALTGGVVSADGITWLLAFSPISAFRALVLQFSVAPIEATIPTGPAVIPSLGGLLAWLVAALAGAARLAWS
jgi:ABC-2 type transport system permease protein